MKLTISRGMRGVIANQKDSEINIGRDLKNADYLQCL